MFATVVPADPRPYLTGDRARLPLIALIVKVRALDTAPPGFRTVTEALPATAISAAGIAAVSWVALTKVVVRFAPFQRTTEPLTKLLPFTVSVKAGPPARQRCWARGRSTLAPLGHCRLGRFLRPTVLRFR